MKRRTFIDGAQIVAGIIVFAALLAMRDAFTQGWARMLIAAVAFAMLGIVVTLLRSRGQ